MTKRPFFLLFSLFFTTGLSLNALPHQDSLVFKSDIRVVKTEWFDVIYPKESEKAAMILAENADSLYERAAALLESKPAFRMPLVVTRNSDELNAYYTPVPRSRIVVFDTVVGPDLSMFKNTLLSVVYHEMIHAVSLNLKHPDLKRQSDFFGDIFSPALYYTMPFSFHEGVTVGNESLERDGRIYNGFAAQILKQAKIEDKFPDWDDVTGFRDIPPSNKLYYIFGGDFNRWLEEKWGMEKYAVLWRTANNSLTLRMNFYNTYGLEIKDAWKMWQASISAPNVPASPTETTFSAETSVSTETDVSAVRQFFAGDGLYASISVSGNEACWLDTKAGSVWFQSGNARPRKLFTRVGASRAMLSADGRYIALSWNTKNSHNKNKVSVYDIKTKKFLDIRDYSLRDAAVIAGRDGKPRVFAVQTTGQEAAIVSYSLETGESFGKTGEKTDFHLDFPRNTVPYSLVDAENGRLAFILKEEAVFSLVILDIETQVCAKFALPEEVSAILGLSAAKNGFFFSYITGDSLPRAGKLSLTGKNESAADDGAGTVYGLFTLYEADISGGMLSPAERGESLLWAANFYDRSGLYTGEEAAFPRHTLTAAAITRDLAAEPLLKEETFSPLTLALFTAPKLYNPIAYYNKGVFLPVLSTIARYNENLEAVPGWFFGATYSTGDPGDIGILTVSGALDFLSGKPAADSLLDLSTLSGAFSVAGSGGTDEMSAEVEYGAIFDDDGFSQIHFFDTLSSTIRPGPLNAHIIFEDTFRWFYGRTNTLAAQRAEYALAEMAGDDTVPSPSESRVVPEQNIIENNFSLAFSTLRTMGISHYNSGGVQPEIFLLTDWHESLGSLYNNLGLGFSFRLPRLLPIAPAGQVTVNLPFQAGLYLFPSRSRFFTGTAQITPFALEIQKGGGGLFYRRLVLSLSYTGVLLHSNASWEIFHLPGLLQEASEMPYRDKLTAAVHVTTGLNAGTFVNLPFEIGVDLNFYPHRAKTDAPWSLTPHIVLDY